MTERARSMMVGVVIERCETAHPWEPHTWTPVSVFPGAPEIDGWRELDRGDGWVRYHAATLPLELHRKETEAYRFNLSNDPPRIYVGLRSAHEDGESGHDVVPFLVTASPYEAQDYLDSGEDVVEGVTMPDGVIAWVQDFVTTHHVDEPFRKRKRKRHDPEEFGFARRPAEGNGRG